jgi:hypothetical protein
VENLFKIVVYALSVAVSAKYADGYWVVGPVFGAAVCLFDMKSFKDLNLFKHAAFIGVSALVYALVYRLSKLDWGTNTDLFEYFIGSFQAAIVVGSVLMAVAHSIFFGKNKDVMVKAMLTLIVAFYMVSFLTYFNDKSRLGWDIPWLTIMIALWQGIYLSVFFGKSKA